MANNEFSPHNAITNDPWFDVVENKCDIYFSIFYIQININLLLLFQFNLECVMICLFVKRLYACA